MASAEPNPGGHINPADEARQRVKDAFRGQPSDAHTRQWDELWQRKVTPWDRSGSSLALRDAVTSNPTIFGSPVSLSASSASSWTKDLEVGGNSSSTGRDSTSSSTSSSGTRHHRKRALVPGCGRGYDALLLAALGYDSYGLDASPAAVEAAKTLQRECANDDRYTVSDAAVGRGTTTFVTADFFHDAFLSQTEGASFDLIFDYTFLCALPPDRRPAWAKRYSELLSPTGHLICLEFPLAKDPREGGPPHGLSSELYVQLLRRPGEEVSYDEAGRVVEDRDTNESDNALVRVLHRRPERTHAAGKETDYVSVWAFRPR